MPKSSVLSPHVRSQRGFLTEKWGPWQGGLFGSLGSDQPSVPIAVVGPEPWERDAPLFDDLSPQYERMLVKALNKQQRLGEAGRARRRGRRRDDVKFYGGRVSHEQLYAREQQAHHVAVTIPPLPFGGVEGYWSIHDEWSHRVMQDTSLPSPYSLEKREEHGPREFGLEAATQLWRQLTIDTAVSFGNFFKLILSSDTDLQEALDEIEGVQRASEEENEQTPLDALSSRVHSLMELRDGWLDGGGKAPSHDFLRWLLSQFKAQYPTSLPRPYIYPTPDGGIQAEWSLGPCDVSLTIDSETYRATWHSLNLDTDFEDEDTIRLGEPGEWERLTSNIVSLLGSHGGNG